MKVRYGKPVKAKSMLSNSFSREVSSSGSYALVYKNWGVGADVEFRAFTEADYSHKFFCYTEFELATNNFTHTGFAAQGTSESTYKPNNYSLCSINKPTANSVSLYVYGTLQNPITVKTRFMIDLTEIGLDNLTAEEFYNRYKGKFGLLATGEEITLDRKVGNIQDVKSAFDGYTEVEYLESTSTQYIDTKYIPNQNTKIIFDTKMSQIPGQGVYPRQGRYGEGQRLSIYLTPSITEFAMGDYKQLSINAWNQRHTYELDVPNLCAKLDGEVVATFEPLSWTNQQSLYLFARHVNTSPYYDGNGNITNYNIKIYESNILVHNFIPCIRNNDNTPGMYDLVDGIFYINQGTGTFIAGPAKSLPSEYQEVEYVSIINNSSNDYKNGILTSIAWNSVNKIKVDLQVINYSTGYAYVTNQNIFLRSGTSNSAAAPWINIRNDSTPTYSGLDSFSYSTPYDSSLLLTRHQTLTFTFVSSSTNNIYVGSWQDNAYSGSNNLYEITFYNNDTIIGKLIPCCRKSDNVIGLYDLVGKQFYTNQGPGKFLKGPNVATIISCKIAGGSSDIYYGYNQLAELPETSGTKWRGYNCTMTAENGVATCVANGGKYPALASQFYKTIYELDHIYMHLAKFKQDTAVTSGAFAINTNGTSTKLSGNSTTAVGEWVDLYFFGRGQGASAYQNTFNIQGGANAVSGATFYVKDCICIDLTDWFGPGKEPSTVQEFKEKFAKEYYGACLTPIKLTRYQIEALPSYGYNQLVNNGNFVDTSCWSPIYGTITANDNICTYTITQVGAVGSNQNRINYAQSWQTNISAQHKFLFAAEIYCKYAQNLSFIVHDRSNGYRDVISASKKGVANSWNELSAIMTAKYDCLASNADMRIGFSSTADSAVGDKYYAKNFILVDLTDWYGAGNEPTTVEEFKQTFPNKYYPYSKKRLLNKYMINKLVG